MKQTKACEMRFKQPQNGAKLGSKPTPRSNMNRIREKHMKGGHMQKKKQPG
jgi:hypothetical protein